MYRERGGCVRERERERERGWWGSFGKAKAFSVVGLGIALRPYADYLGRLLHLHKMPRTFGFLTSTPPF